MHEHRHLQSRALPKVLGRRLAARTLNGHAMLRLPKVQSRSTLLALPTGALLLSGMLILAARALRMPRKAAAAAAAAIAAAACGVQQEFNCGLLPVMTAHLLKSIWPLLQ